jgi:hypothetical protein
MRIFAFFVVHDLPRSLFVSNAFWGNCQDEICFHAFSPENPVPDAPDHLMVKQSFKICNDSPAHF